MTIPQTKDLIRMLLTLCPRDSPKIDRAFALAWSRALLPYRARDVEAAALEYSRHKAFFPELSTLTANIKPISDDAEHLAIMYSLAEEYMRLVQNQIDGELRQREEDAEFLRGIEYCDNQCKHCHAEDCEKSPCFTPQNTRQGAEKERPQNEHSGN